VDEEYWKKYRGLYQVAGTSYPDSLHGRKIYPLRGKSFMDFASGIADRIHDNNYVFGLEHREKAMLRKGDWKILNNNPPFHPDGFRLYNISEDPAELYDLKNQEREKYLELIGEWSDFSTEMKLRFPTPQAGK
jgi:arylsulfatase